MDTITREKWETCRGIGYSFGYNQVETAAHLLTSNQLINMLVDIVSKNGNLLINVGPKADGSIPENQLAPLRDLGKWLIQNGQGIFDTNPWKKSMLMLDDKTELRFTKKGKTLYVFFLTPPKNRTILIPHCSVEKGTKAILVGEKNTELRLTSLTGKVQVELPEKLAYTSAFLVKIVGLVD
jgi:alpha-L-fucosidase